MARGINKVILIGNLGDEPTVRKTHNGNSVANISMVTNEMRRNENGEYAEFAEWHRVVLWGRLADVAAQYLHKGSQVYIEGKLRTRSYMDKQNQKRSITEIVADEMQMLGSRPAGAAGGAPYAAGAAAGGAYASRGAYGQGGGYGQTNFNQDAYGQSSGYGQSSFNQAAPAPAYGGQSAGGYGQQASGFGGYSKPQAAPTAPAAPYGAYGADADAFGAPDLPESAPAPASAAAPAASPYQAAAQNAAPAEKPLQEPSLATEDDIPF